MEYKYCHDESFEDLACGRVIYHRPGMTNFPVRLAQEIFGRCLNYLDRDEKVSVYDPCCGGGYLLTVLGLSNMGSIGRITASDISEEAVLLANRNLSLLTEEGLENRIKQLESLYNDFQKDSHKEAIESARRLLGEVRIHALKPDTRAFQGNILEADTLKENAFKADIVITDVPYGNLVAWQGAASDFIDKMLDNLVPVLRSHSVIAICSDKKQKIKSDRFKRLEKQLIGKRKFEIFSVRGD